MKGYSRDPVIAELRRAETRLANAIGKASRQGYQIRSELRGEIPSVAAYRPDPLPTSRD